MANDNPFYNSVLPQFEPQTQTINAILRSFGSNPGVVGGDTPFTRQGYVPPSNRGEGVARIDVTQFSNPVEAAASAEPGSTLFFPPGLYKSPAGLGNGIAALVNGLTFEFAPGAEIQVQTWGQPGIDLMGRDDVTIKGGVVRYIGTRGDHTGSYRGGALYTAAAGAYISGDRCTIDGLRTIGMPLAVYLSSWDGADLYGHQGVKNTVKNVECESFDFGVLFSKQDNYRLQDIYGHDDIDDSSGANPTHVIYGSATSTQRSTNGIITGLRAKNILGGCAYQVKYTDTTVFADLIAKNCAGLYNLQGCTDTQISNCLITDHRGTVIAPQGAAVVQDVTSARIKVSNITVVSRLDAAVNQRLFYMYANDGTIDNVHILSNRNDGGGSGAGQITGDRIAVRGYSAVENNGIAAGVALILGDLNNVLTTNNMLVAGVRCKNFVRGMDIYGPTTGVIKYERALIGATGAATTRQNGTGQVDIFRDNTLTVTGTPEGVVTAPPGTIVQRTDGGAGTGIYVKETGTGNTGWVAK